MLPHLDAAYNLACWLTGNADEAQDLTQESFLKAFRHFHAFRGENSRAWLLAIVRNVCYDWLQNRTFLSKIIPENPDGEWDAPCNHYNPELATLRADDKLIINRALAALPFEFREAIVLRELEDCTYNEISVITGAPLGTVMSRLARGREQLRRLLTEDFKEECRNAVR